MRNTRFVAAAIVLAMPLTGFASTTASSDAAAPPAVVDQFAPIERGSYRLATLGTDVSMRLDADYWMIMDDHAGMTVFADAGLPGSSDRDVTFVVPSRLVASGSARAASGMNDIDIDQWLEQVDGDALSLGLSDVMVGGRRAMRFDFDLTTARQPEAVDFLSTAAGDMVSFEPGRAYNIWWFDGDDPMAIVAGSDGASHPFLFQAEELLEGLAFADTSSALVADLDPGQQTQD